MFMVKFSPTALNFGYDFVLLVHFFWDTLYIDKFHFKNHVGKECVQKRDPYKIKDLNDVNTQAAEQLFRDVNKHSNCPMSGDVRAPFLSLLALHL